MLTGDLADQANEIVERGTEQIINNIRQQAQVRELVAGGYCWFCEEKVSDVQLFCDLDCSNGYEAERRHYK